MSQKGHNRTHAVQQTAPFLDHPVGSGDGIDGASGFAAMVDRHGGRIRTD